MSRSTLPFALAASLLLAVPALGQGADDLSDLEQGREAFARRDYAAAAEHLEQAIAGLDRERDRAALADAYLQLGTAYLVGLERAEAALAAFVTSAELAENPATAWLWAGQAAERLGRMDDAREYQARALARPPAAEPVVAAPAEPEPAVAAEAPAEPAPVPGGEQDAVDHFFGKREQPASSPPTAEKEGTPEAARDDDDTKEDVDAVQHFFGRKKKPVKPEEEPPSEDGGQDG